MSLNVNRSVHDTFYRYKMPRLQAKVEGKGNGVKTVIPNMMDVARALGRPPTYTTKFFGCELGAQTKMDCKSDRYIVNGIHDVDKLQDILDGFIKKFVLCEKCDNPETVLTVKKALIIASCKACGHVFTVDMGHKLAAYILKHPPDQAISAQGTSLTEKKDKKSKSKKDGSGTKGDDSLLDGSRADDDDDDDDWGEDISEEAQKARLKDLTAGFKVLTMDSDMEKSETERINLFHQFVKKMIDGGDSLHDKAVHTEAERLEITNKAPIVLCELLLDSENILGAIKKNKKLFLRFTMENTKAQKYLLGGIEKTIEVRKGVLLPKAAHIFKAFYDEDILEEEVLLEWSKKVSKKYVSKDVSEQIHKKVEPFINWLKEAEEESEDDSDGVELEFDERAKISTLKEVGNGELKNGDSEEILAESKPTIKKEDDDGDDDLDIDDI